MAEEIVLVGQFRDNITPQLRKLSRELNNVSKSFTKIQKKLRPVTKEMGNLAMASERVAEALKEQKKAIDANSRSWKTYQVAVGKAGAAQRKAFKGTTRGGRGPASTPRMGGGGGSGAGAVAGGVLGVTLGNAIQGGVISGFRFGVSLMQKPFTYLANAISERIGDEMADIQSAGGMFAIDQRSAEGERLFKGFQQARDMQEDLNRQLARSAAALPGATNDYVRAARGLTDTVMQAFQRDQAGFAKLAREMGVGEGATAQEQIAKVLSKFTEQTVLLGQGGSRGGIPLPVLMEQLVTREGVNIESMKRRFAQLMYNPLLASALEDSQDAINATAAGSAERMRAVMEALQKALPEEVITAMRNSVSGMGEAIRSAFLDPDTGLLGLGRDLALQVPKLNQFGQYVDKNGKVVKDINEAVKENTTVFKMVRESLVGFLIPLSEIASFLPALFDPLLGIAESLVELREMSAMTLQKFNAYTNWFKEQKFPDAPQRGALAAFNKLLESIGAISKTDALNTAKELENVNANLGEIAKKIFQQLFNSDVMATIGEALGSAIGSVFSAMASALSGANDLSTAGPFAQGFKKGFDSVKGGEAARTIIQSIFRLIGKGILEVFKAAPFESSMIVGGLIFGPALVSGLTTLLLSKIGAAFAAAKIGATLAGWLGAVGPALSALKAAFSALLIPLLKVVAIGALIALALYTLYVIFRDFDLILSSTIEVVKILGNSMKWVALTMVEGVLNMWSSIFGIIRSIASKIPGGEAVLGFLGFNKAGEMLESARSAVTSEREATQSAISASAGVIGSNTMESLNRTGQDFDYLRGMVPSGNNNKNTVSQNNNVSVTVNGAGMNEDQLADTVARKVLTAVNQSAQTELNPA